MAFKGDFLPVLHKHTKGLELTDLLSTGVVEIQRNFELMKCWIDDQRHYQLSDER